MAQPSVPIPSGCPWTPQHPPVPHTQAPELGMDPRTPRQCVSHGTAPQGLLTQPGSQDTASMTPLKLGWSHQPLHPCVRGAGVPLLSQKAGVGVSVSVTCVPAPSMGGDAGVAEASTERGWMVGHCLGIHPILSTLPNTEEGDTHPGYTSWQWQ